MREIRAYRDEKREVSLSQVSSRVLSIHNNNQVLDLPLSYSRGMKSGKADYSAPHSILKGLSALLLIFCAAINIFILPHIGQLGEKDQTFYYSVFRMLSFAFPCFVMELGRSLLDPFREISFKQIFGKGVAGAVWSLILFGFIYRLFDLLSSGATLSLHSIMYAFYEIFTGSGWPELKYAYAVLGLLLLTPFYRMISRQSKSGEFRYLLILLFIFQSLFPLLSVFSLEAGIYIPVLTIYPFYFFLGNAVHRGVLQPGRIQSVLLFVMGVILIFLFSSSKERSGMESLSLFFEESAFPAVLMAFGLFSFFDNLEPQPFNRSMRWDFIGQWENDAIGEGKSTRLFRNGWGGESEKAKFRKVVRKRQDSITKRVLGSLNEGSYSIYFISVLLIHVAAEITRRFYDMQMFSGLFSTAILSISVFFIAWFFLSVVNIIFKRREI